MSDALTIVKERPALLGGPPECATSLGIVNPLIPELSAIQERLAQAMETGQLTNHGIYVRELEKVLASYLDVRHVIAVANGTVGLTLLAKALDTQGDVIVPSFTFSATAHALTWAGQRPVFADILPYTYCLDPSSVERAITPDTVAIMGVHLYGHPCEIDRLQDVADRHGVELIFDAAHAFGSRYGGQRIGSFGTAEVFSFHASKILAVGEGGAIATNNDDVAARIRTLRTFGDTPGSNQTQIPGLNGKMQEFNALIGLESLKHIDRHIAHRRSLAKIFTHELSAVPGVSLQAQSEHAYSNYQNLSVLIHERAFGLSRDQLQTALQAEGIHARPYFYPALHQHEAYAELSEVQHMGLPITERVAKRVLCLPIYSQMTPSTARKICAAVKRIQVSASDVRDYFAQEVHHDD